jgi:hypothetical protein
MLQVGETWVAKLEKRGRYKYSGLLDQKKYNGSANSLNFAHISVRKSKSNGPRVAPRHHFWFAAKLLVIRGLAAECALSAGSI